MSLTRFNQTTLNNTYNAEHGTNINGTCGNVAMSTLSYYFRHSLVGYDDLTDNINDIFEEYVAITGNTGSGGAASSYKNSLETYFSNHEYDMNATRVTWLYRKSEMKNEVDANRPTIISVWNSPPYSAHAMVVIGYKTYRITYKNWLGTTFNKKEVMFCIDEGWKRTNYSYLQEDHMPATWEITSIVKR